MNYKLTGIVVLALATTVSCAKKGEDATSSGADAKASYAIGANMGTSFREQGFKEDIDVDKLCAGIKDSVADKVKEPKEELQKILGEFQQKLMKKRAAKQAELGEKNTVDGKKFLDTNKAKEGVTVTQSGLQYKVITKGTGSDAPKATDKVKVNYKGTLTDGTEFDSSYTRGEPAVFQVDQVIKGWTEALEMMKVGDKWELVIPSELAYGAAGAGGAIAANAVLVFEVELLEINPDAKEKAAKEEKSNAKGAPTTKATKK